MNGLVFSTAGGGKWRKKPGGTWCIQLPSLLKPLVFFCFTVTTLDRAERLTGRQIYDIHKVLPLRRHQCLNSTFYSWQRKPRWEKKWNKWSSIKTFDGCVFSLNSHRGQRTLLNWTTDRHIDASTPKRSCWTWPLQKATYRGKRKNALATKTKKQKDCQWIDKNSGQNGDKT